MSATRFGKLTRKNIGGVIARAEPCPASKETQKAASPTRATRPRDQLGIRIWLTLSKQSSCAPFQFVQNVPAFPLVISVQGQKQLLLAVERFRQGVVAGREDEQKQSPIFTHGEPPERPPWTAIHQVYIFIARSVSRHLESRDRVAKVFLELMLRSEYEFANL